MGTSKNPLILADAEISVQKFLMALEAESLLPSQLGLRPLLQLGTSPSGQLSLWWCGEEQKSLEVIPEILQPNLEASPHEPDGSNQFAPIAVT